MKIYHRKRGTLTSDASGHDWTRELPQLEAPRTNDQAVRLSSWVARKNERKGREEGGSVEAKVALNFMTFWGALKLNKFIGVRRIKNLPNSEGTKRSWKKAENIMCSSWIPHIEIKAKLEGEKRRGERGPVRVNNATCDVLRISLWWSQKHLRYFYAPFYLNKNEHILWCLNTHTNGRSICLR